MSVVVGSLLSMIMDCIKIDFVLCQPNPKPSESRTFYSAKQANTLFPVKLVELSFPTLAF